MAQISMSEALLALGTARGEPILTLATLRIRATLDGETPAAPTAFTSQEDKLAAARTAVVGDDALLRVMKDVASSSTRRKCIYARNGVCY